MQENVKHCTHREWLFGHLAVIASRMLPSLFALISLAKQSSNEPFRAKHLSQQLVLLDCFGRVRKIHLKRIFPPHNDERGRVHFLSKYR